MGLYDRLLARDSNGRPIPYLASSWSQPDANTIHFKLRSGVKCTDGTPLTATDVANSFNRLFKTPAAANVFGAGTLAMTADDSSNSVTMTDTNPNPDAIYGFPDATASVICPSGLADDSQLKTKAFGTGPYTLTSAIHGSSATLTKNKAWRWGPSGLTSDSLPDTLAFSIVSNNTTAANELTTGALDLIDITGPDVARLRAMPAYVNTQISSYLHQPLMMNGQAGHPTADPLVRKAIMTAINPKEYLQASFNGEGEVGTSLFSKNSECYDPATAQLMPTPSVADAKSILVSDGYVAGSDGLLSKGGAPLNITLIGTSALQGQGTEYVAAQLAAAGMHVNTSDTDVNTWFSKVLAGKFDVFVAGFSKAVPAASVNITFWSGPLPPNGSNFSWIVDPTTEADIAAALPLIGSARCAAWHKYQEDVLKDYDMLPLVAQRTNYFSKKGITFVPSVAFAETETIRPTS